MVTTDWAKFREYKDNGLVKDVFSKKSTMDKLKGGGGIRKLGHHARLAAGLSLSLCCKEPQRLMMVPGTSSSCPAQTCGPKATSLC